MFYPYSVKVNKCSGICNNINYHSNCECECDKSCDFGEYLDYENCKCIKRLIDKLDEKFNGNIDGNKLISAALNDYEKVWNSCIIDISIT